MCYSSRMNTESTGLNDRGRHKPKTSSVYMREHTRVLLERLRAYDDRRCIADALHVAVVEACRIRGLPLHEPAVAETPPEVAATDAPPT